MFTLQPLTAADADDVAGWRYPGPYAFYDTAADPEDLAELLDVSGWAPDSHFGAWDDALDGAPLAGFFTFERAGRGVVDVGLGMRPERAGLGQGERFVRDGLAFARRRFAPRRFTLAVAAFNQRAITVYRRVGFVETGRHARHLLVRDYPFVTMALEERRGEERDREERGTRPGKDVTPP